MSALAPSAETTFAAPAITPHIAQATETSAYALHHKRAGYLPVASDPRRRNGKRAHFTQNYTRLTHTLTGHSRGQKEMQARAKLNGHHENTMQT